MSFRLKTILGVALIEATLLVLLVWRAVDYLRELSEESLILRANTSARSIADVTRDAVLTTDLARLNSVAQRALDSPGVVYVRISDSERALAEHGAEAALQRPFSQDASLDDVEDGVFDTEVDLFEGGYYFGRVQLGLSVAHLQQLISDARRRLGGIALIEMALVALFSFLLGTYLTRSLNDLARTARAISDGALGSSVDVSGGDEIAATGRAFNTMSIRLAESHREMARRVSESAALSARLSEKEQRLATILATAVDGFVTIDENGVIDEINAAGAKLFGYEVDELVGHNVSCLMPQADRSEHDGYLKRYRETGERRVIGRGRRVLGARKDGSTFPMDLAVSEMKVGALRMFVGLVRDLSDQIRAERAARRSETMRAAIVDANLDALVTIDAEDRIVEFNGVAETTFGFRRDAVLGQRMSDLLVPPELRESHLKGLKTYIETGEGPVIGNRIEVESLRADGERFPVELTVQPVAVDDELLFTALVRDISDRKAEEHALRLAKQRAEGASEAKSRFLAHMSHEIRSPMNAVLGSLGLLLDGRLDNDQRLYAKTAEASGKILLSLINDILDFSKIEAGQLILEVEDFAVRELATEAMDLVAFKAREKGLYAAALVAPDVLTRARGDATRLRQILVNLLDNAVKFTEEGIVILTVEQLGGHAEEHVTLRFAVEDSGIGIAPQAQPSLFEEFQQVDSSDSTRHGGSGLGLSICQGLANIMGGAVGLESTPGRGSRFWVDVPLVPASQAEPAGAEHEAPPTRLALIVGFPEKLAAALRAMCGETGCDVDCVRDVDAASSSLRSGVGLMLVDSRLPGDTLDALARLGRAAGAQRLLVAPASTSEVMQRVTRGEYDELVTSPFVMHQLMSSTHLPTDLAREALDDRRPKPHTAILRKPSARILLAEDSEANQLVATAMLRGQGYAVDVASNGREAIDLFKTGDHHLILMDVRMPEVDGLAATAAIRAMPGGEKIRIIAMTANALQQDVDRCLAAGMDDFVPKPFDKARLLQVLAQHLGAGPTDPAAAGGGSGNSP